MDTPCALFYVAPEYEEKVRGGGYKPYRSPG